MSEYIVNLHGELGMALAVACAGAGFAREEIVRCRDCKHAFKADLSGNWYECMKPDGDGDYARWDVEPGGFCKWGERRQA